MKKPCERCGKCCNALPRWDDLPDLERAFIRLHDKEAEETFKGVIGTKCPNLDFNGKRAMCKIYKNRPKFCRAFNCEGVK